MIANTTEVAVAIESLQTFTKALELLRLDLKDTNPTLFPIVSQTYLRRILDLQTDILSYYAAHETSYNPQDADLADAIRDPRAEYAGHFVADNSDYNLPEDSDEAPREPGQDSATSEVVNTALAEGIRIGVRTGKLEILVRMISSRFGSVSMPPKARLEAPTPVQIDRLVQQFVDFKSEVELDAWMAGIEQ